MCALWSQSDAVWKVASNGELLQQGIVVHFGPDTADYCGQQRQEQQGYDKCAGKAERVDDDAQGAEAGNSAAENVKEPAC